MSKGIDEILTGEPAEAPETEAPVEEAPAPEPEAEPTGEKTASPPEAKETPPPAHVPKEALIAERRQRQELEARLKELEEQIKAPKPEQVGLLDDPEKWEQQLNQRVQQAVEKVRMESQAQLIGFLETQVRAQHPDYDEVVQFFASVAKDNPALTQEALRQPNPVEYAYTAGKRLKMLNEAGDLDKLLERERAKAREEALAEARKNDPAPPPQSLSEIPSAKDSGKYAGPKPLSEMLPNY